MHTGLLNDLVVVVCNAAAHDYLVAVSTLGHGTKHRWVAIELFLVNFPRIGKLEAQARCAVRQRRDVVGAADTFNDVGGSVLDRCHFLLLSSNTTYNQYCTGYNVRFEYKRIPT